MFLTSLMAQCPWADWRPTRFFFCEESLCGWIRQPINSWSNIFYLIAALFIWRRWRSTHPKIAKPLFVNCVVIGLGSFFLHSSMTFAGEIADRAGIVLLFATFIFWNLTRYDGRFLRGDKVWFYGLVLTSTLLFFVFQSAGDLILIALMGLVLVTELVLFRKKEKTLYFWGVSAAASFTIALPFWWFEAGQRWCSPHSQGITGHVVWHLLTALSVVFVAQYYSQFGSLSKESGMNSITLFPQR